MTSTILFADFKKQEAKDAKAITVEFYEHTKTRLSVSFRCNETSASVNFIPAGSEGFKFHTEDRYSMISGNRSAASSGLVSARSGLFPPGTR